MKSHREKIKQDKSEKEGIKQAPKWFFVVLILIPVIFFIILEISLRLFNYGIDSRQWVDATEDKLMLNSEVTKRYFYNVIRTPQSNQDMFDIVKKDNSFRVFALGESSAEVTLFLRLDLFLGT